MNDIRAKFMLDLQRIEKEQYQLREGEQLQDFIPLMLKYIGDPDPELRDNLIYPTFYTWIHEKNKLSEAELRSLLAVLLNEEHLFYAIGSQNDQSVFTRTFTALAIVLIVRRHRQQPFLDLTEFQHLKDEILRYYKEEKDLRGYLEDGGWAHSAAHGADMLVELVQCSESDAAVQVEVLAAIQSMLYNGIHIFNEEEDERIATIVDVIIEKEFIPLQDVVHWINGLAQCVDLPRSRQQVIARVNSKNVLRCLYFRRDQVSRSEVLLTAMISTEQKLNKFAESKK
ncbi:DUF2785 domain-containing protein [Paenibacillus sp. SC116]|uniref:DUF2785 domain-containing protein n=1 Tax=Paenibacillus sp. SC116 TaxID=2968986 RepID=UPI00215B17D0|nr:DUF2785 domain-containing protein [Paenibacillus sp. SC116]MCR8842719.1 DUF2785 domain-containing protein [Paenibacillus sp. SC116]